MKKLIVISSLLIGMFSAAFAQQNVVKVGLTPLIFRNANVTYERMLTDGISINATVGLVIPSNGVPGGSAAGLSDSISDLSFGGFQVTPEVRFYTKKNGTPQGFYLAPFLRFRQWNTSSEQTYATYETTLSGGLTAFGGGLQLGAQWIIKDVFVIDWYFLGVGLNYYNLQGTLSSTDPSINWDEVQQEFEMEYGSIDDLPGIDFNSDNSGAEVTVGVPFVLPTFRTGISLGFAF